MLAPEPSRPPIRGPRFIFSQCFQAFLEAHSAYTNANFRGCNLHPTRWQKRFLQAPPTYTLVPHAWLPEGLKMIASSWRTELNRVLACLPDGATIRITYEAAYCRLTFELSQPRFLRLGSNEVLGLL